MTAVFSVTDHPNYLFFIPITAWSWNQIGCSCVIFYPERIKDDPKFKLAQSYCRKDTLFMPFSCPKDAEATYAQVSRLFAAVLKEIPQEEVLITTDCDMMVFGDYFERYTGLIDVFGADLLPGQEQYPICYIAASCAHWWYIMSIGHHTYQQCLDLALAHEPANADMRGNLWARDQELVYRMIKKSRLEVCIHPRANKAGFAKNRIDRDDGNWPESIDGAHDFHMFRPGHQIENFAKIMRVVRWRFEAGYQWMETYHQEYTNLL